MLRQKGAFQLFQGAIVTCHYNTVTCQLGHRHMSLVAQLHVTCRLVESMRGICKNPLTGNDFNPFTRQEMW